MTEPGKDGPGVELEHSFPKAEDVVRNRRGDVLIKNTLLKADHFPGAWDAPLCAQACAHAHHNHDPAASGV